MLTKFTFGELLIIEDNPDIWVLIKTILPVAFPGIEAVHVISAPAALDYFQACINQQQPLPRLILQNLYLPERADGINLLNRLKQANSPYRHVPVVVMSSSNDPTDQEEIMRIGANTYLIKPGSIDDWIKSLQHLRQVWWES